MKCESILSLLKKAAEDGSMSGTLTFLAHYLLLAILGSMFALSTFVTQMVLLLEFHHVIP